MSTGKIVEEIWNELKSKIQRRNLPCEEVKE